MKRVILAAIAVLALSKVSWARQAEWADIPRTSYTEVATPGPIVFSSVPIQFVGITVSSPAVASAVVIFRSTSFVPTQDIATQTLITTDFPYVTQMPVFIPMFDMANDSFTFVSKIGTAKITYWVRCPKFPARPEDGGRICPGLSYTGSLTSR